MVTLDFLEKVQALKGLNDGQLAAIQGYCQEKEFIRNDRLFAEGEESTHLWIVVEGQVDLRYELPGGRPMPAEDTISFSGGAQVFGWSCFVPPYKYRLSAYCATRTCKVVRAKKEDLLGLFEQDPKMGYVVMSNLVRVVGSHFDHFQEEVAKRRGHHIMSGW